MYLSVWPWLLQIRTRAHAFTCVLIFLTVVWKCLAALKNDKIFAHTVCTQWLELWLTFYSFYLHLFTLMISLRFSKKDGDSSVALFARFSLLSPWRARVSLVFRKMSDDPGKCIYSVDDGNISRVEIPSLKKEESGKRVRRVLFPKDVTKITRASAYRRYLR